MTNPDAVSNVAAAPPKQAVVLVHGMGEQTPMQTLRSFVETMWVRNPDIAARRPTDPPEAGNPVWWKPDQRAGSFELSRITTRAGGSGGTRDGPRTDFYEFYWADLTDANKLEQLRDWFMSLLWRRPRQVPADVMPVWILLWLLTAAFGALSLWNAAGAAGLVAWPTAAKTAWAVAMALYGASIGAVLAYFGDVARYVRAKPPNIAARRAIRERGLALLTALSDSCQYDRIVVVGHSLGAIIAYDLVKLLWSGRDEARTMTAGDPLHQACLACRDAGARLEAAEGDSDEELERYRAAQQGVFAAMQGRKLEKPWLISDLVTVGSPLTHADFLMSRDHDTLDVDISERRFPSSPPVFEDAHGFLYQPAPGAEPQAWQAHHAAPFAAVRWTNIYDRASQILLGDLISGPAQPNFGPGIKDVPVQIRWPRWFLPRLFTHTAYWTAPGQNVEELRSALDLLPKAH